MVGDRIFPYLRFLMQSTVLVAGNGRVKNAFIRLRAIVRVRTALLFGFSSRLHRESAAAGRVACVAGR
jgi:hypothetical protein